MDNHWCNHLSVSLSGSISACRRTRFGHNYIVFDETLINTMSTHRCVRFENFCREDCTWWRHQMETFSVLLAICARNSPVPGEFLTQRPVTRSFDVFFDLRPNKRLCKHWWGWWFKTPSRPLWRHCNDKEASTVEFMMDKILYYFVFASRNVRVIA